MSVSVRGMFGGQPSTTQPIAGPWLSPKVVTRKRWPNVLNDMLPSCRGCVYVGARHASLLDAMRLGRGEPGDPKNASVFWGAPHASPLHPRGGYVYRATRSSAKTYTTPWSME